MTISELKHGSIHPTVSPRQYIITSNIPAISGQTGISPSNEPLRSDRGVWFVFVIKNDRDVARVQRWAYLPLDDLRGVIALFVTSVDESNSTMRARFWSWHVALRVSLNPARFCTFDCNIPWAGDIFTLCAHEHDASREEHLGTLSPSRLIHMPSCFLGGGRD